MSKGESNIIIAIEGMLCFDYRGKIVIRGRGVKGGLCSNGYNSIFQSNLTLLPYVERVSFTKGS